MDTIYSSQISSSIFSPLIKSKLSALTDLEKTYYMKILDNIESKYMTNSIFAQKFEQYVADLFKSRISRECIKKILDRGIIYTESYEPIDFYKLLLGKPIFLNKKDFCACLYYNPNIFIDDLSQQIITEKTEIILKKLNATYLIDFENNIYASNTLQEILNNVDSYYNFAISKKNKKSEKTNYFTTHKIPAKRRGIPYYNPLYSSGPPPIPVTYLEQDEEEQSLSIPTQPILDFTSSSQQPSFHISNYHNSQKTTNTTNPKFNLSFSQQHINHPEKNNLVYIPPIYPRNNEIPYVNPLYPHKSNSRTKFIMYDPTKLKEKYQSNALKNYEKKIEDKERKFTNQFFA